MRRALVFFGSIIFSTSLLGQTRGENAYHFLNLPVSARVAALGGNLITVQDGDPTLGADNPALLNPAMDDKASLSYINYFAGINYGYSSYTKHKGELGTFNAGIKFLSYGKFDESDEFGNEIGSFTAGEYAMILGWSKKLDSSFSVGANFKPIYSTLYTDYSSFALALDLAATYQIAAKKFMASFLVKNIGREVVSFRPDEREKLPFDVEFGVSKQPKNMPVRFSLIAQHLAQGDLRYDSPLDAQDNSNIQFSDNENEQNEDTYVGNLFRHLIINAELIPSKNFNLRLGYNFRRRREMVIEEKPGSAGISWGVGFKVSKFHIDYGRSAYHLAGSPNYITIVSKISDFSKKQ